MEIKEVRVTILGSDFDRSLHFYHETLELTEMLESWESQGSRGALLKVRDGVVIEIIGPSGGEIYGGPTPVAISLSLRLESPREVDRWHHRLAAAGAQVGEPPTNQAWGERSCSIYDPDGNAIRLFAALKHVAG